VETHIEHERRFLVLDTAVALKAQSVTEIRQAYLFSQDGYAARVRLQRPLGVAPEGASLRTPGPWVAVATFKGPRAGTDRAEYETQPGEFPLELAMQYCDAAPHRVHKYRFVVRDSNDAAWEVDQFLGANAGLWIAECEFELDSPDAAMPSWCGPEISGDHRFDNEVLAQRPLSDWQAEFLSEFPAPRIGSPVSAKLPVTRAQRKDAQGSPKTQRRRVVDAGTFERRFLVRGVLDCQEAISGFSAHLSIDQGYLYAHADRAVRVRRVKVLEGPNRGAEEAFLGVKDQGRGAFRHDLAVFIEPSVAADLLHDLRPRVVKERYQVNHDGLDWDIDVFGERNLGLVIAQCRDPRFGSDPAPGWASTEVTADPRFRNESLAQVPCRVDESGALSFARKVFLVHGHQRRREMQELLRSMTSAPVQVLADSGPAGTTIIEKLEAALADEGTHVFVLLTADDLGRPAYGAVSDERPRARQNVVLEHGFSMGRFGRSHVTAIVERGVELYSDMGGIEYLSLDDPDFAPKLRSILVAAGFDMIA